MTKRGWDHNYYVPITIHCKHCGSQDVVRDAWVRWHIRKQRWVRSTVCDAAFCNTCDDETTLIERVALTGRVIEQTAIEPVALEEVKMCRDCVHKHDPAAAICYFSDDTEKMSLKDARACCLGKLWVGRPMTI